MRSRVDCRLELKAVGEDGRIEGMASTFGNVDFGYDRIERGAFAESLKSIDTLPMLWQHRADEPIGVWENLRETRDGLITEGQINLDVNRGREARSLASQGAVTGLSIGFFPTEWSFEDEIRVLKSVELFEVSLVTFPMNDRARVSSVKFFSRAEIERALRTELGLSRRTAEALTTGGYAGFKQYVDGASRGDPTPDVDADLGDVLSRLRALSQSLKG